MTQTFVAGLCHRDILAPMLLPCPMTGTPFKQWLEEALIPEMEPGSIVIIDNLPAQKVAGIRQCLEEAGMGLPYLPPYTPDFNPIEQAFAKLKALLRRRMPRGFDAICDALNTILQKFSSTQCSHYIRHSGYGQM